MNAEEYQEIKREQYKSSGERALAENAYTRVLNGEQITVPYLGWNGIEVQIYAAYRSKISVLTGTNLWFKWAHKGRAVSKSHAINFDFGNNPFKNETNQNVE